MRRLQRFGVGTGALLLAASGLIHAQGRGGGAWTTTGGDAQRTGWVRTDPRISKEAIGQGSSSAVVEASAREAAGQRSVSQPVLLPNIISYKGFKALAFLGGANTVYSLDYDLNRMFWQRSLGPAAGAGAECAAGPVAVSRSTPVAPAAPAGRGGGFGGGRGAGNNVYAVSSTGMVHALNPQTGEDVNPPAKFTGGAARIAGAVFIDNVVYAAVVETCGSVAQRRLRGRPDRQQEHGDELGREGRAHRRRRSVRPSRPTAPSMWRPASRPATRPSRNAIVALDPRTLNAKDWFTATTPFTSSPIVFTQGGQTLVAASNADGSVYVLDAASLGGSEHKTPLGQGQPPPRKPVTSSRVR